MSYIRNQTLTWSAAALTAAALAACASTGQPDVVAMHHTMKIALSAGDPAGAVQGLSNDVVFSGSPACTDLKPCVGKDQFQERFLKWALAAHMKVTPLDSGTVLGDATRVRIEVSWDGIEKSGVQRLVGFDQVRARDGQVVEMRFIADTADAQTSAFMRGVASGATSASYSAKPQ
ncbi:MAG: nuclear transport factor 2 family protein [Proteobacteria bacterium]|nr:nuclear transport factor 2 family protein [Pseudomonadota bacterium]